MGSHCGSVVPMQEVKGLVYRPHHYSGVCVCELIIYVCEHPCIPISKQYYSIESCLSISLIFLLQQLTAALIAIAAFIIIFSVAERAGQVPTHPHAIIGIFLMFFMLIQPINGIL